MNLLVGGELVGFVDLCEQLDGVQVAAERSQHQRGAAGLNWGVDGGVLQSNERGLLPWP